MLVLVLIWTGLALRAYSPDFCSAKGPITLSVLALSLHNAQTELLPTVDAHLELPCPDGPLPSALMHSLSLVGAARSSGPLLVVQTSSGGTEWGNGGFAWFIRDSAGKPSSALLAATGGPPPPGSSPLLGPLPNEKLLGARCDGGGVLLFLRSGLLRIGCIAPKCSVPLGGPPPSSEAILEALVAGLEEYRSSGIGLSGGILLSEHGGAFEFGESSVVHRASPGALLEALLRLSEQRVHAPLLASWSGGGGAPGMQSETFLRQKVEEHASLLAFCRNAHLLESTREPQRVCTSPL